MLASASSASSPGRSPGTWVGAPAAARRSRFDPERLVNAGVPSSFSSFDFLSVPALPWLSRRNRLTVLLESSPRMVTISNEECELKMSSVEVEKSEEVVERVTSEDSDWREKA